MNCLICKKALYSSLSKGCMMCGMPLVEDQEQFCCKKCKKTYLKINSRENNKILVN